MGLMYDRTTATASDVLVTVSSVTNALTHSAQALSSLAETAAVHADDYHQTTVTTLRDTRLERTTEHRNTTSLRIAQQIVDRDQLLSGNDSLKRHYNEMQSRYLAADAAALTT